MADQNLGGATIKNVEPDDWRLIKCADRPKPEPINIGTYSADYSEDYA